MARPIVFALVAALAVHAALVAPAVQRAAPVHPDWPRYGVIAVAAVAMWQIARRFPTRMASVAFVGCVALAVALLGPGPVAVIGLMVANAVVVGTRFLSWTVDRCAAEIVDRGLALPTMAGMALWIGLMAASAEFPVHRPLVYATLLIVPFLAFPRTTAAVAEKAGSAFAGAELNPSERWWIGALAVVAIVHLFVIAKPEVGYDASTMHLQFAEMMAKDGYWRYDVTRFAWAVMPLGADHAFAAAYLLGSEAAARLFNLAAGALALSLLYRLARRTSRRDAALASITLFASSSLAFVETGSLFSEPLWLAFLLATLVAALEWACDWKDALSLIACALAAAGAMQTKAISVVWLGPLVVGVAGIALAHRSAPRWNIPIAVAAVLAAVIAAWPYANAWVRTGNPVFPFINRIFGSPYIDAARSFNNAAYNMALRWSTPYDIVLDAKSYIEGRNGSSGFHWLLAYPLVVIAALRARSRETLAILLLAAVFFAGVYTQQSYLRYLVPFFALLSVLFAFGLSSLPDTRLTDISVRTVGLLLLLLNLHFIGAGGHGHHTLCLRCSVDPKIRAEYVFENAPLRTVGGFLNRQLPDARVAYLVVNGPSPAGFVGYARSSNWHDQPFFNAVVNASSAEDVLALVRRHGLDHAVFEVRPDSQPVPAIAQFRERYTTTVWQRGGFVVAKIQSSSGK